jgi:hypothetical protein
MSPPQRPTDAHSEEEDPFASDGEQETHGATAEGTGETESAEFRENPGKQLCEHVTTPAAKWRRKNPLREWSRTAVRTP